MSESICVYMPSKNYTCDIRPVHFVYETEFHKLNQPFFYSIYYLHIVTNGSGTLKVHSNTYSLKKGDIFFALPACLYSIEADSDFEYIYISFMGTGAKTLTESFNISYLSPVYHGFEHLIDFWQDSIKRVNQKNINVLTESVLLYTLSFLMADEAADKRKTTDENLIEKIVGYIDVHYHEPDLSLNKLAQQFSYTEKYLSCFFKKHMKISFRSYLNKLRIQYAFNLIENGETSVNKIALRCGYKDSMYFSKVFKSLRNMTPSEYIKLMPSIEHKN